MKTSSQFGVHEIYQTILFHDYQKTTPQLSAYEIYTNLVPMKYIYQTILLHHYRIK